MGFLNIYESWTDDYGNPISAEEGRALRALEKRRRRHSVGPSSSRALETIQHPRRGHDRLYQNNEYEYEYSRSVIHTPSPPPPPAPVYQPMPGSYSTPEIMVLPPSAPAPRLIDNPKQFAKKIADVLTGPGSAYEQNVQKIDHLEDRVEDLEREAQRKADRAWAEARKKKYIEEEAHRQVMEENRRALDMLLTGDSARRYEHDQLLLEPRGPSSVYSGSDHSRSRSRRRSRSRSRSSSGRPYRYLQNCHDADDCEHIQTVEYDLPRGRVRYVTNGY